MTVVVTLALTLTLASTVAVAQALTLTLAPTVAVALAVTPPAARGCADRAPADLDGGAAVAQAAHGTTVAFCTTLCGAGSRPWGAVDPSARRHAGWRFSVAGARGRDLR